MQKSKLALLILVMGTIFTLESSAFSKIDSCFYEQEEEVVARIEWNKDQTIVRLKQENGQWIASPCQTRYKNGRHTFECENPDFIFDNLVYKKPILEIGSGYFPYICRRKVNF